MIGLNQALRGIGAAIVLGAVVVGCRQTPTPSVRPSPAIIVTPVPLPRVARPPIPVRVPTPISSPTPSTVGFLTPPPLDPPPVGNQASSGSVTGNGSSAGISLSSTPAPTPTPTPTPTPGVTPSPTIPQTHVQTIVYGQTSSQAGSPYTLSSPGPWAPYVSYVWTPLFSWSKAMQTAGLKLMYYDNPMQPQDSVATPCSSSSSQVYDCTLLRSAGSFNDVAAKSSTGTLITSYSGIGLAADPTQSRFNLYWQADLAHECQHMQSYGATYDLIFMDNNAGTLAGGFSATPATWNATNWGDAFATAATQLGTLPSCFLNAQIVTNSFGLSDSIQSTMINAYLNSAAMVGGEYEHFQTNGYGWYAPADSEILAVAYLKANSKPQDKVGWVAYLNGQTLDASSNPRARLFGYASYLIAYDLHYTSYEASFKTPPSQIQIYPETEFIPLGPSLTASVPIVSSPLCATTCTTSGYNITSGVFVQYYTNGCYFHGSKVSDNCEIAVNPTGTTTWSTGAVSGGTTQTIPNPNGYAHQMVISGGGTMDGGTISFSGLSTTSLPPQSGEILVP